MKKIILSFLTVAAMATNANAQLPAGSFFEYEFTGGSLNNTSSSGAPNFTGSITSIADRNASANDAADITGVLSGASVGATNVNEMTLTFWMKHDPIAITSNERILQIYGTGGNGFRLQMDGNQLLYNGKAGNGASPSNTASELVNIDDAAWHHIAIRTTLRPNINNSDTLEFDVFLDNVLQPNISNTTINVAGSITNFLMNANLSVSPTNNYSGDIDDIYFYKSALTDAEIAQIYFNNNSNCIVNIPDANFKAYLVGNALINTNGNTEIECSEASAYTGSISASGLSMLDATGIEAFTSLTFLTIGDNPFPSIDLTQNISLISLDLSDNYAITNLDVSTCTSLQYFTFSGATDLVSIDLSNNILLTKIDLGYSQSLSALDVSLNTSLNDLQIDNSTISSLNVANGNNSNFTRFKAINNPNLTCITVDNVANSTTNWTQIDAIASFSLNCTPPCTVTIPDANFKAYLVGNAAINTNGNTEIECSEATAFTGVIACNSLSISDLTGIEAFTALTSLYCYSNSLTTLDLSQNPALTGIYCFDNLLTTLNLNQNMPLTILNCNTNQLTSLDLSGSTSLTGLYCGDNQLTSLNVANGNNINMVASLDPGLYAVNNPNLTCIQIDAGYTPNSSDWAVDATVSFSTNCGTVGIDELSNESLSIYPNPVQHKLFIELANQEVTEITIIDYSGRVVKTITNNNTKSINISDLTKGIYILKVATKNGFLTNRFIKQ